ncbi:MAG: alpha/beta hydrolase [Gemmatimonadaceae bacterium]
MLSRISSAYRIDPKRISIAGFSDGATYALALGRLNGTLFRSVVAFSPGMLIPVYPRGSPAIFISHGTRDTILRIDITSRRVVPELRRQGYSVEYHEFDGPHAVPPEIAAMAMRWISERVTSCNQPSSVCVDTVVSAHSVPVHREHVGIHSRSWLHQLLQISPLDENNLVILQRLPELGAVHHVVIALAPRRSPRSVVHGHGLQLGVVMP